MRSIARLADLKSVIGEELAISNWFTVDQQRINLFAEATKTYEKLNRLVPNNPQLLTDMGTSFAKAKDFDRAFALYDRAIELQPDYFLVWSNRGNLLAELSFNAEALVVSIRHKIKPTGQSPRYTMLLGVVKGGFKEGGGGNG